MDNTVQTIHILDQKMYYLDFYDQPVNSFTIMKYDADTREPLADATFRVTKLGSTKTIIGEYITDANGKITIDDLLPGSYEIEEIKAPDKYVLDRTIQTIALEQNKPQVVTFFNHRYGDLLITKINNKTKAPIEGVKFKLTKQDGTFIGEYITDTDGYISLTNLEPGFYIVQETECPPEYVRDITPKSVEIKSNQLQTVQFANKPKSRVFLRKLDADTGTGVAGAVFTVEKGSTLIGTFTSGVNGEVEVGLLDPGDYVFTETTPPPNYSLNGGTNDIQRMSITDTNEVTVTFQNYAYGNLLIIKRDELDNRPLAGAEFTVSYASGAFYGNYTTMSDGTILISNIEPGIYLIRETRAPNGYLLDNAAKTVTVPAVVTTEVVFLNRPKSGIQINKIDKETRGALSGAEFKVTRANGEVIGTKVTDVSGNIIFDNLEPGTYIVTETRSPDGYVLDATSQTIVVTSDKITTVYFENRPLSDILITKRDSVSKVPLSGAVFKITKPDGSLIGTYTTNVSGMIQVGDLVPGTYIVSEVSAPDGYVFDNIPQTVEVKSGKIAEIEFFNKPLSGIKIIKTDSVTNKPLSGAKFKVSKLNGELVGHYVTSVAGDAIVSDLEPGSYNIQEVEAPAGYVLDNASQTVEVKTGRLAEAEFLNDPYGSLDICKYDSITGAPLKGAVFKVVRELDNFEVGVFTTAVSGNVVVPNLIPGVYVISETKAPDNYVLDQTSKTVTVIKGTVTKAEFENKPYSGIQITKKNSETGETVAGAEFKVTKSNGETVGTYTTDSSGTVIVENLAPGHYTITETKAPQFYVLNSTPQTIEIKADKLASVEFLNIPYGSLVIAKTNAQTGGGLEGAVFEVKKVSGEFIGRFTTGADGIVIVRNLVPGTYLVTEVVAPAGYELDSTPQTIQVGAGSGTGSVSSGTGYPEGSTSMSFVSNNPYGTLEVVKLDKVDKSKALEGATFELRKADGTYVDTQVTDVNGKIFFGQLKSGNYVITETVAPAGYEIDTASKNVTITAGNPASVAFYNNPYSSIEIIKTDEITHKALLGATFEIIRADGSKIGTYKTDISGKIIVPDLQEGVYIISETVAPDGYHRDETPRTVTIVSGRLASVEFTNRPYSGIEILKIDSVTKNPLPEATFIIERISGEKIGQYTTDQSGKIIVSDLPEGSYIISETVAPDGYICDSTPRTVVVKSGFMTVEEFVNKPKSGVQIKKTDSQTGLPLEGAKFKITKKSGDIVGEYVTDKSGLILIETLEPGWYSISETYAPYGYLLDSTAKDVEITHSKFVTIEFSNAPLSGLQIKKIDAKTGLPLQGAKFKVMKKNGELIGEYVTDRDGMVHLNNLAPGWITIVETFAPQGYLIDSTPKDVEITNSKLVTVEFENNQMSGVQIKKTDAKTGTPLQGAKFRVTKKNGELIGEYVTDRYGMIYLDKLAPGWITIIEAFAPEGYQIDSTPKDIEITYGKLMTVEFENQPLASLQIKKINEETGAPLAGAQFKVIKQNGEFIGEYTSDKDGLINIPNVIPGWYTISEMRAPDGFILDESPKTVEVKTGAPTIVTFGNKPLASLRILKLDSVTRNPIEGVEFAIAKISGEKVENDFRGYTFKTDKTGQILIPNLANGYYLVTETRTVDGYILDGEPKTVLVESGKTTLLEVENTPASGLLIVKTDSVTGEPLEGVVFDVKLADGQFVAGSILDGNQPNTTNNSPNKTTSPNGDITGSYTTDANGRILINGLAAGQYTVTERKALDGYELDKNVYNVTVLPGKLATLQLTNKPLGGIRLIKIDSVTKKPIYNVEFMLFDKNNKNIGVYYTDNNGIIDFPADIPAGRYTIRETRAAAGYYIDEIPKTIEFVAGKVTEVRWENTPHMGQIQITKKSADENPINGFSKGTLLQGAVFEIYDRAGNLMDTITSNKNGLAVSKTLPLGRYIIREVKAPMYYMASQDSIDAEIEFTGQILRLEVLNKSMYTNVSITKRGYSEVIPGQQIRYDFTNIGNNSTVALDSFYWRDTLPTDAVRLNKIVTGTWSHKLNYKIVYKTNVKSEYRTLADSLSTEKNNVIDASPAALSLAKNEYVTEFMVVFGRVPAGFKQVEAPYIFCDVLSGLAHEYRFSNKCDAGGLWGDQWIMATDRFVTVVYNKPTPQKLPRTGY